MPIPDFQTVMRPLLAYGADGNEENIRACIEALSDQFHLTDEEREQTVSSGPDETISGSLAKIQKSLESDLLERISEKSPHSLKPC
jgi:restriction endonuclease Mrr